MNRPPTRPHPFSLWLAACLLAGCVQTQVADTRDALRQERISRGTDRLRARSETVDEGGARDTDDLPRLSGALSLPDAVTLAMANNRILRAAYLSRSEAEGVVVQAVADALPAVNAQASSRHRVAGDAPSDTYSLGVEITQPLWRSGAVSAGLRYARLYAASNDATVREHVQNTVFEVVSLYMDILLRQHLVEVYEQAAAVAERLLETTRSQRRQGTVSDYAVLRAEVEVARTRAEHINALNALHRTRIALFQSLGASQDSRVDLDGRLVYRAESVDRAAASAVAAVERPEIARAQAALKMSEARMDIVAADYGPKADLFGTGEYANTRNDAWEDAWIVGARVSLKLFDGFERRGRMMAARSQRDQAIEMLRDAEERAHANLVDALLRLDHADALYQSQKKNIALAGEGLRMIEAGSTHGRNTPVDVLDARAAFTEAMGAYYHAIHGQGLARLGVRHAMGTLSPDDPLDGIVAPSHPAPATPAGETPDFEAPPPTSHGAPQ